MINIADLKEEDKGRWVEFSCSYYTERGRIKSWNGHWIFVVYYCANEWDRYEAFIGVASDPEDLSFMCGG
jgi:hypothetical protein